MAIDSLLATQPVSLLVAGADLGLGLLRPPRRVSIDVIEVDATLSEAHLSEAEVTQFPVEEGANISDHIRPRLREYRLEGVISDSTLDDSQVTSLVKALPFVGLAAAAADQVASLLDRAAVTRSQAAYNALTLIQATSKVVTIKTPLQTYDQMAMLSLSVTRGERTGEAVWFSAHFREIRVARTQTGLLRLSQAPLPLGFQPSEAASAALKKRSGTLLFQAYQSSGSAFLRVDQLTGAKADAVP